MLQKNSFYCSQMSKSLFHVIPKSNGAILQGREIFDQNEDGSKVMYAEHDASRRLNDKEQTNYLNGKFPSNANFDML